jgi:hypothetical protein
VSTALFLKYYLLEETKIMKRLTRFVLPLALLLALLAPGAVFGQEEMPCFGLSQGDCTLMYSSQEAMAGVNSFTIDYTFALSVTDVLDISSGGGGNFSSVPDAADPLASLNMDMATDNTATIEGETESATVEFRIIDGNFYLGIPMEEGAPLSWMWVSLQHLVDLMAEESGMPFSLEDLMSGEMAAMGGLGDMSQMAGLLEAFLPYITAERGADADVAGNPVAVFTTTVDLAGMFGDPGLSQVVGSLAAIGGAEMSEEELQQVQMFLPMLQMLFQQSSVSMVEQIGVNDSYTYGWGFDFAMTIDPMMMAMFGGGAVEEEAEPVDINLSIFVQITNHNQQFKFTVPEGAIEITEEELSGGF